MMRRLLTFSALAGALLACALALLAFPIGSAQGKVTLPSGFSQSQVVSGLTAPTDMEFAPDGRLFVTEQAGKVLIAQRPGGTLATFLDLSGTVDSTSEEQGLLGITFDPQFSTNHFVYLYYTRKAPSGTPAHNRVVRVTARGDKAVAGSEKLIFRLNNQSMGLHQGGAIDFAADGKLYVASGSNATETSDNAQKLTNLFGKVLRINKDGTIPSDNPFYTRASGNNRAIWALGLRNPFKFAVKPATSLLFINDVGSDRKGWEEINRGKAGANYGWPVYEGRESNSKYTPPLYAYGHGDTDTTGCAITGGTFYNPATVQFPKQYVGDYFFADLCNGWIRTYDPTTKVARGFATGLESVVDLEVSKKGELYHLSYLSTGSQGSVGKISFGGGN
jgi:glucose/arabinose dehydrogenase